MAYKDLHEFISVLETRGELVRIKTPVDPNWKSLKLPTGVSKPSARLYYSKMSKDLTCRC
jgi:hypothetical protein